MAEDIRGLSVKFDADFSEFRKGMKQADKDIGSTQRQLKNLQSSLELKWDPKKFSQAQQQAQKALEATEEKAALLRKRLAAMESSGVTDETRDEYNYLAEQLSKTELSAQKLEQQLEDLDKLKMKNLTAGIDKVSSAFDKAAQKTKGLSVAAAGAVAGIAALGLNAVKQADEVATLATTYNMSATALQRFNYVALQTDTENESLYKGFVKVQAGVSDLKSGVESVSTKALKQLGLSFEQFDGAEEQFYAIIDSLSSMEDQAKMVSLANDIFGERMSTGLLPLIYAGTAAINEYKQEFEETGYLTEDQVKSLAEFDNQLNEVKTQFANVGLQLGSSFLPLLKDFSETLKTGILPALSDMVKGFSEMDKGTQKLIVSGLILTAILSPLLKLISGIIKFVSFLIPLIKRLDKALLSSIAKWSLLVVSVGTLFSVLSNWTKMNTTQKVIGLLGSLAAAALSAALAFGVFHSAWSVGLAVAGIVAGIAAATAAVKTAGKEIGAEVSFDPSTYASSVSIPEYNIPSGVPESHSVTSNTNNYVDNSNTVINIEKNEYMTEDDIIKAVNKGLKLAKQTRT